MAVEPEVDEGAGMEPLKEYAAGAVMVTTTLSDAQVLLDGRT